MIGNTILTSWGGCPQSRLYHEVVVGGDRTACRLLTQVARQWDHTLAPRWLVRIVPGKLQPLPFDVAGYGAVLQGLSLAALRDTLEQVTWLRGQAQVRRSLRSVAFLEAFEAAVAHELEQRLGVATGLPTAPTPAETPEAPSSQLLPGSLSSEPEPTSP